MKRGLAFLFALTLCGPPGWAADGSVFTGASTVQLGTVKIVRSIYLCDTKTAASTTCTTLDLSPPTNPATDATVPKVAAPDLLIFELNATTGCSGSPTVAVQTSAEPAGTTHEIDDPAVTLDSTTTRVVVDMQQAILDRYIRTGLSGMTDCTDLEVLLHFVEIVR